MFIIGSLGNHSIQTLIAGLSSSYEGIDPIIIGTAFIVLRNINYPEAWRDGGLIQDQENKKSIESLADKIYKNRRIEIVIGVAGGIQMSSNKLQVFAT